VPELSRITLLASLALALSACGTTRYTHRDSPAEDADQAVIKGYSRSFLFAADELAFDLSAADGTRLMPYLTKATVDPGRYCLQVRRWKMFLRGSGMTLSNSACFDAQSGHTYLIRSGGDGYRIIDRQDPVVVTVTQAEQS